MNRLVFYISFLIILLLTQTAHTATTCSLPLQKPATSDISGFSILDSGFSLFGHLHKTPHGGASSYDYDASVIFTQVMKVSEPGWVSDLSTPMFFANASDYMITAHFRHSGVYSYDDHHLKRNSWFPVDGIEEIDTKFTKKDGSSNLRTMILTNYQGWIPDVGYDVIDIVPAPGAVILGGLGIGMIGWMRRRKTL